jgi:ketosteroid isomerase-like protein
MKSKIRAVMDMESAAFAGNWELFKSFLSEDVYYRVGNAAEVRGPHAVVEYLQELLTTKMAINDLQQTAAWETEDAVILELKMKGLRIRDNQSVTYPCVDVYRFRDGKINDWRVYPIESTYVA